MPGIIAAAVRIRDAAVHPDKGTLLRRDLPLIAAAAGQVPVSVAVSLAVGDAELHRDVERARPRRRRDWGLIAAIRDAGLDCHVNGRAGAAAPHDSSSTSTRCWVTSRPPGPAVSRSSACICVVPPAAGSCPGWRARIPTCRPLPRAIPARAYLPPSYREHAAGAGRPADRQAPAHR